MANIYSRKGLDILYAVIGLLPTNNYDLNLKTVLAVDNISK